MICLIRILSYTILFLHFLCLRRLHCAYRGSYRPLKALLSQFAKAHKGAGKTKWVNSPNVYQKVEVLETGTPDPKKITKVQVMTIQDSKK